MKNDMPYYIYLNGSNEKDNTKFIKNVKQWELSSMAFVN